MKTCTSCRYYRFNPEICARPLSDARSPVDGELTDRLNALCDNERRPGRTFFGRRERCGPDGQFHKPLH